MFSWVTKAAAYGISSARHFHCLSIVIVWAVDEISKMTIEISKVENQISGSMDKKIWKLEN